MRLKLAIAVTLLSAACLAPPPTPALPPPQATGDVVGLTVFIDPNIELTSSDSDCDAAALTAAKARATDRLADALTRAGLIVVTDPGAPHATTLRLHGGLSYCQSNYTTNATWQMVATLEGGSAVLAKATLIQTSQKAGNEENSLDAVGTLISAAPVATYASRAKAAAGATSTAAKGDSPAELPAPSATPPPPAATLAAVSAPPPAAPRFLAAAPQPNALAIVIGVEKYPTLPAPTGARTDAQSFAELARTSLGVSSDHVQLLTDAEATKAGIERSLAWASSSVAPGGRIYFFFSGHGAPDAAAGTSYIVPVDGDPKYLDATGIPMREILDKLGKSKAREVVALVDSCFSGAGGRSVLPPGARPLVRVKEETAPAQLALFSASSGSQISGPGANGRGLFTSYVLDALGTGAADINGDGQVSVGELAQWVSPRVARDAKKDNRDQTPALTVGKGLGAPDGIILEWGLPTK